jgi:preprotein translocase subunit SecE
MSDSQAAASGVPARKEQNRNEQIRPSLIARIALFIRQVIAELKKVVSPTRHELITYTIVVIVFVAIIMAFVGLIDYLIGLGVFALLG